MRCPNTDSCQPVPTTWLAASSRHEFENVKRDDTAPALMRLADDGQAAGVPSREGFFWCEHCRHVITLGQREVDAAESAPAGSLVKMKCPRCKHHEVRWKFPTPRHVKPAPEPVSLERGRELFAGIYALLECPQPTHAAERSITVQRS